MIYRPSSKSVPQRSLSLSPGWKIGEDFDKSDEVELFLEKYVLPLQEINSISDLSNQEYDSGRKWFIQQIFINSYKNLGHHSLETSSGYSGSLKNNFSKKDRPKNQDHKDASSSRLKLVTIVNINGEVTSFKTVRKKYPEKNVKVSRSKTLPSQSSLYRNSLKVTVNGTGCLDFKEVF